MFMSEKKNAVEVKYTVDGEELRLTPSIVQKFLVNGNSNITEQEFVMFASLCKARGLNPFLKDAYLVKYGNQAQIIVGKDALFKRADNNPDYDGIESGVIVEKDGDIKQLEGTFVPKGAELVGAWAKVYRKSQSHARSVSVNFNEYCKLGKDGKPSSSWATMPAIMITKVAMVMALREAFPNDFSGMYINEEFNGREPSSSTAETQEVVNNETGEIVSSEVIDVEVVDNNTTETLATTNQIALIKEKVKPNQLDAIKKYYGVEEVEQLTVKQASEVLTTLK